MLENPFAVRKLIEKSTAPYAKNPFCLMTDVSQLHGFNEFSELMQHAAKVFPDSWYICFNIPTTPKHPAADLVRLVPSILNDFNKSRMLRRAKVSGLRMCNLYERSQRLHYVTDILASCTFDAVAISSAIADYLGLGNRLYAVFRSAPMVKDIMHSKKGDRLKTPIRVIRQTGEDILKRFWRFVPLSRHEIYSELIVDNLLEYDRKIVICFESHSLSLPAMLEYVMNALSKEKLFSHIEFGARNETLQLSRYDMIYNERYLTSQVTNATLNLRFRNYSAFGSFFRNPNYSFYK